MKKLILFDREIRLLDFNGKELHKIEAIDKKWSSGAFGEGFLVFKNRDSVVCYGVE